MATRDRIQTRHTEILNSAPRTERKLVSILFIDIKGSMDLISAIELEEWWAVIDNLFELMCESVYRFGGWVSSFTGDGITAVFETTGEVTDHAQRACQAALWLRDAIRAPASNLWIQHGVELSLRIGINSGEVLTGTIGDRYKRQYTANGHPVGLAKRIETLAQPRSIYLSENTAALVTSNVQLRGLGRFEVKGVAKPVRIFELLGIEPRTMTCSPGPASAPHDAAVPSPGSTPAAA
jgi:class 3 adenylate cyclase